MPACVPHEGLDRPEEVVRDLRGGAPGRLAEAAEQPLVAEERGPAEVTP